MPLSTYLHIGIFLYDFASSASISSKLSQETKHIYILQNSLRKQSNATSRKSAVTLAPTIYIVNSSDASVGLEDRIDDNLDLDLDLEFKEDIGAKDFDEGSQAQKIDGEQKTQVSDSGNVQTAFKIASKNVDRLRDMSVASYDDQGKIDNHAMIYRVRKNPSYIEEVRGYNEEATPLRIEGMKEPQQQQQQQQQQPVALKRHKYPQLSQYRYPHTSRNIQDIIKYLISDSSIQNRGFKFTGYYVGTKKYDMNTGGVAVRASPTINKEYFPYDITIKSDPLYHYKPKDPSEVNLLAPSDFRFSPIDIYTSNSQYDPYYQNQLNSKKYRTIYQETLHEHGDLTGLNNYIKKQKPKPFSLTLDIYPVNNQNEHIQNYRYNEKYAKLQGMRSKSLYPESVRNQQHQLLEEEEEEEGKQQMILHLNLYPRRKSKEKRNGAPEKSSVPRLRYENEESPDEIMIPLDTIAERYLDNVDVSKGDVRGPGYDETLLSHSRQLETIGELKKPGGELFVESSRIRGCETDCDFPSPGKLMNATPADESSGGFQGFVADSLIAID